MKLKTLQIDGNVCFFFFTDYKIKEHERQPARQTATTSFNIFQSITRVGLFAQNANSTMTKYFCSSTLGAIFPIFRCVKAGRVDRKGRLDARDWRLTAIDRQRPFPLLVTNRRRTPAIYTGSRKRRRKKDSRNNAIRQINGKQEQDTAEPRHCCN